MFALLEHESPRYQAYKADVDVAKAEMVEARVLPNPSVTLAVLVLNSGFNQNGVGTYYANATLPLLIGGQRRMRMRTARSGVRAAEAMLAADYHELAHEARALYVELQADQSRVLVHDAALEDLEHLQEVIVARRESGFETDYGTLRIEVEIAAWNARRAEAEAAVQDTSGRLGVLLGLPDLNPEAEGDLGLVGVRGSAADLWRDIERAQPEIVAAKRNEAYAARTIDLAKRERWPVPTVNAGTVVIQNYYSVSTQFGVTVPIPLFDWGQGAIARAKSRTKRATREKEAVISATKAELERALALLRHSKYVLATFDADVRAKLPRLEQMAEDSFRAGEADLIELLDATRTRFEIELARIDLLEAAVESEVDVLAVTGRIEDVERR